MNDETRHSIWMVLSCVLLSIFMAGTGVYALLEKKMLIPGKYSGNVYSLSYTESVVVAASQFMIASFYIVYIS